MGLLLRMNMEKEWNEKKKTKKIKKKKKRKKTTNYIYLLLKDRRAESGKSVSKECLFNCYGGGDFPEKNQGPNFPRKIKIFKAG